MRTSRSTVALVVLAAAVYGPTSARGQCPAAPNGSFTTDVTGWSNFATWDGTLGNPVGSDRVGPITAGGSGMTCGNSLSSCLPVNAGNQCTLSAEAYVPVGQPTGGQGALSYLFYSDAGCSTFLSQSTVPSVPGTQQGTWVPLTTGAVTIPVGAQSARISLNVCAAANTSMTINWDNVVSAGLQQEPVPTLGSSALLVFGAILALAGLLALRSVRG
jgi:hypothetical protein